MKEVEINKNIRLSEHLASPSEATLSHSNKLDGLRLSPHFSLAELTKTSYHTQDGNIPSHVAIENLRNLCVNWLEDLRYIHNRLFGDETMDIPVVINSGFRSEEVNRLCGGAQGSNHLTGCAVDIRCMGPEHQERMKEILLALSKITKRDFDELIIEKRGSTRWIHFAVRPNGNRRRESEDLR